MTSRSLCSLSSFLFQISLRICFLEKWLLFLLDITTTASELGTKLGNLKSDMTEQAEQRNVNRIYSKKIDLHATDYAKGIQILLLQFEWTKAGKIQYFSYNYFLFHRPLQCEVWEPSRISQCYEECLKDLWWTRTRTSYVETFLFICLPS